MNAATLNRLQRRYDGRAPIFRFPAARYTTLPEDIRNNAGSIPASGDGAKLSEDKSGNSSVNVLCLNGSSTNYASFTALTAFGTGNFTVSAKVQVNQIAAGNRVIGGLANSPDLFVNTSGNLIVGKSTIGNVSAASTGAIAAFQTCVITYVKSGTTGTYYIDGVASGTATDNYDYTAGLSVSGIFGTTPSAGPFNGNFFWVRAYSVALTAPQVAADAAGTVQSNSVLAIDYSLAAKLATSFTATTGGTVTINTSGATGARISGARDLYQGTAANQPILTIAASGNYLTFDGSNDYWKAAAFPLSRPNTIYFAGQEVTWTVDDAFFDGDAANSMLMAQGPTSSPRVSLYNGGAVSTTFISPTLATNSVITSVFQTGANAIRLNRQTSVAMDNSGSSNGNGFTLGAKPTPGQYANITAQEVLVYAENHDEIAQQRMAREQMRQRRIAA